MTTICMSSYSNSVSIYCHLRRLVFLLVCSVIIGARDLRAGLSVFFFFFCEIIWGSNDALVGITIRSVLVRVLCEIHLY